MQHWMRAGVGTAGVIGACTIALIAPVGAGGAKVVDAAGPMVVFANAYGDGRANPTEGAQARVHAVATPDGKTIVTLDVWGLPPGREFGSHVHQLACANTKAGPHYQNLTPTPPTPVSDPAFANPDNEIWLDFTTNAAGRGEAHATVDWVIRPDGANAVIVHDMHTHTEPPAGTAGPKLACLDVDF
jgi:Cu-Zn family superoxide dismutase